MTKKDRINIILERMNQEYGREVTVFLEHENAWQLLIAVILSAQCTDKRVNIVTKDLFKKYASLSAFAEASVEELENDIRSTGFYHNKAVNIIGTTKKLINEYDGIVPDNMDSLLSLPGVGRKTANVILGQVYGIPSIVVDTHVKRIAKRLGLTKEDNPELVEYDLMKVLPKEEWILVNIHFITLGRTICTSRNPLCDSCYLKDVCKGVKN